MADRKRIIRYMLLAILLVLTAIVAVREGSHRHQRQPMPASKIEKEKDALMTLIGIHQTATKEGKIQWELDADSAQLEALNGRMTLSGPKVDFIMKDGSKAHLTALTGVLDTRSNDMTASGQVHLRNDQYQLQTEALKYLHKERLLSSDTKVHILGPAFNLRADRMTYNLEENRAYFDGRVEGNLNAGFAF